MSRLIDGDALWKVISDKDGEYPDTNRDYECGYCDGLFFAMNQIEDAPTIEPTVDKDYLIDLIQGAVYDGEDCARLMKMVEPKTGKWFQKGIWSEGDGMCEEYGCYWECSECHKTIMGGYESGYNFCPNCGARMQTTDGINATENAKYTCEKRELECRNKEHYDSCKYVDKCNPIVCFKALDELGEKAKGESDDN